MSGGPHVRGKEMLDVVTRLDQINPSSLVLQSERVKTEVTGVQPSDVNRYHHVKDKRSVFSRLRCLIIGRRFTRQFINGRKWLVTNTHLSLYLTHPGMCLTGSF